MPSLEDLQAILSANLSVEDLERQYPRLSQDLKRFSLARTLGLCAGLQTRADLHANTVRLEALTHLAALHCAGAREPTRHDVDRWLNTWLGEGDVPRMEDPPEDLFSENVMGPFGNRICFTGLWEGVGGFLQDIVDVLQKAPEELHDIRRSVFALLAFSNVAALRAGIRRYEPGSGSAKRRVNLPREHDLRALSSHTVIDKASLAANGLSEDALAPFILDLQTYRSHAATQRLDNSDLLRKPVIDLGESLVLGLPGSVGVAIQMYTVAAMSARGEDEAFRRMLRARQADTVFNRLLRALDVEPFEGNLPSATPPDVRALVDEAFFSFDVDKFCHVVLLHGGIERLPEEGPATFYKLDPGLESQLTALVASRAEELSSRVGVTGGMTLIVRCGLAGGFAMTMPEGGDRWHHAFLPLNDLHCLCYSDSPSVLTLWKLLDFRDEVESKGVAVFDINGLLNLYAYWQQSGHELAPRQIPLGGSSMVQVATNYVQAIRVNANRRYDSHAALRHAGSRQAWIGMYRRETHPYFAEVTHSNLYVSHERARQGVLMGLAKGRKDWWVVCEPEDRILAPDGVFRVWDALMHWIGVAIQRLDLPGLPPGPINVDLRYGSRESWDREESAEVSEEAPRVEVVDQRTMAITIGPGIYRYVARVDNQAERLLVRRFLEGTHALAGAHATDDWYESFLDSCFEGPDARMLHTYHARSWRDMANDIPVPTWRRVRDEDSARALFDLMPEGSRDKPKTLRGRDRVNGVLHPVVDRLWDRIKARLGELNQVALVNRLLENVEAASREVRKWKLTARAIQGLHGVGDHVVQAALRSESDLQTAIFCSRILIEMSICEARPSNGRLPSKEDLDFLLAGASQLTYVARCSDALHAGWIPARLVQHPNGAIEIDQSFHSAIVQPYHAQGFRDRFQESAQAYERAIEPLEKRDSDSGIDADLAEAFRAEFGLAIQSFTGIVRTLGEMSLAQKVIAMRFSKKALREKLGARLNVPAEDVDAFIERFALLPRKTWPTHKPQGVEARDWQPWRFRRRLSLVTRPLIGLGAPDAPDFLVAPGLLEDAARHLLRSLSDGSYSREQCRSERMRQWLGRRRREESEAFEDAVADALRARGLEARVRIPMTSLGAPANRGEIDVLAWDRAKGRVLVVECKDLMLAKMEAEIAEQLNRFRGEAGDELEAHMLRMQWLRSNRNTLNRTTGLDDPRLVDLLVTSRQVPLQYTDHMSSKAPPVFDLGQIDAALQRVPMAKG